MGSHQMFINYHNNYNMFFNEIQTETAVSNKAKLKKADFYTNGTKLHLHSAQEKLIHTIA